jgi:hypothetical protein
MNFSIRIKGLQPRVSEEDTLFYWSTVFGFVGFGLWTIYFMHCSYQQPHGSVLYILLANIFGSVVYLILFVVAASKTAKVGVNKKSILIYN